MLKDFPETAVLRDFHYLTDRDPSSEYPKVFIRSAQRLAFMEFEDEESATSFFTLYQTGGVRIAGGNTWVQWSKRAEVETQKEINQKLAKTKTCRCVLVHVMAVKTDFNVERVKEIFSPCGNLVRVAMWKDEDHPDVQKMCLEFQHPEDAARAVELLDEKQLHPKGDLLRVTFSFKKELYIKDNSLFKVDFTRPRLPSTPPPNPKAPPPPPETRHPPAIGGGAQSPNSWRRHTHERAPPPPPSTTSPPPREQNPFPPPRRPYALPSLQEAPVPSRSSRHPQRPFAGQGPGPGPRGVQPGLAESEKPKFLRGRRHRETRGVLEPGVQPPVPRNEQTFACTRGGPGLPFPFSPCLDRPSLSANAARGEGRDPSPMPPGRGREESNAPLRGSRHSLLQAAPDRGRSRTLPESPFLTPQGEQHQHHQQQSSPSPRILRIPSQQQQEQGQGAPRPSIGTTQSFQRGSPLSGALCENSETLHGSPLFSPAPFLRPTAEGGERGQPARGGGERGHRDEGEGVAWGVSKDLSAYVQQLRSPPSRPLPFQIPPPILPFSGLSPSAIPLSPLHAAAAGAQQEQKPQGGNRNDARQEVQRAETGQHGLTMGFPVLFSSPSDTPPNPVPAPPGGSMPMSSLGMPIGVPPLRSLHSPTGTQQQPSPSLAQTQGLGGKPGSIQQPPLQEQSPEQIQQALLCLLQNILAQQQLLPRSTATGLADPASQRLFSPSVEMGGMGNVPEQSQIATVPAAQPQPQRAPLTPANLPVPLSQQLTAPTSLPLSLSNPQGWAAAETPFPPGLPETFMGGVPPGGTLTPGAQTDPVTALRSHPQLFNPQLPLPVFPHIPASAIPFAHQQQQQDGVGLAGGTGFGLGGGAGGGVGMGGLLGFSFVDLLTTFLSSSSPSGGALRVSGYGSGSGETAHPFPCMGLPSTLPFLSPCTPLNASAVQLEGGHGGNRENRQDGGVGRDGGAEFDSNRNMSAPMHSGPTVGLSGRQQTPALSSREAGAAVATGLKPSEGHHGSECGKPEDSAEHQQQEEPESVDEEEEGEVTGREEETETDGAPAMCPGSATASTGTRRATQSLEGRQMPFSTFPFSSLRHSSYSSDRESNGEGGEEDEGKAGGQSD
uniref:RRM domain-containing protein n=1 Tax=Chromera velia CCMP2878 TaxID=1169474 RepID=A0A0G4G5M3_9ALVE|eukprot:Cvel_20362.t1-p1 / transcript=Cvel_20362.t1 / gene=Cvel_20362 / organism=Chromera_velia_CCMP2878 / gene_product=hypothetical protein / transcript_product=hypothetical protein / location=Cvel_scaffold1821:31014-35608(+) / protein_length=1114 / sequence_SO=supercontig / SO=protein_coding / is_pseudo=false